MPNEKLTALLEKNALHEGFNALLADSNHTAMVRNIRSRTPGMEIFIRFETFDGESVALFFTGGECESCATGEGRYQRTGPIREAAIADMGLALILKDPDHYYVLNLDKALSL